MPWRYNRAGYADPAVPKLANLTRARRAGLVVPETAWALADELERAGRHDWPGDDWPPFALPCIVRSGSPSEDTAATSNAGQFVSMVVRRAADFPAAVQAVIGALPVRDGRREGVVFVQPLVDADRAGVTFFDGFYFEETSAAGGNAALTAGQERGRVERGHLQRDDPRSEWLERVHRVFGGTIDLEWAEPRGAGPAGRVLLQARPALFPVRRNQTLSLANHKEILGDPPSPWMVGLVAGVGRSVMRRFEEADPPTAAWAETYSVELAGRAWLNFSAFYRLMDRWGLPRSMVTEGVGGSADGPLDAAMDPGRFARSIPTLLRLQADNLRTVAGIRANLRAIDAAIEAAEGLPALWRVSVEALRMGMVTMIGLGGLLSGLLRVRRALGVRRGARVVTQEMMEDYAALAARPDPADRLAGLDGWLARYGHRGPLESDPSRPRFAEMRDALAADLARDPGTPSAPAPRGALGPLLRPLFWAEERRERFRDELMRRWARVRARVLDQAEIAVAAGHLDAAADVFWMRGDDLDADPVTWRALVAERRADWQAAATLELPTTAGRDAIDEAARVAAPPPVAGLGPFLGIGLGAAAVEGNAVVATELAALLGAPLPPDPILVVPTLEPSWAVLFPRLKAVVAELGGELSHAAILLREARIPAVINAPGAFRGIPQGARVYVDPRAGAARVVISDRKA